MKCSQASAARYIYCEEHDDDNEDDISRFIEKFKKEITRITTSSDRMQYLYEVMCRHPDAVKVHGIKMMAKPSNNIDEYVRRGSSNVSKSLDVFLQEKYDSCDE